MRRSSLGWLALGAGLTGMVALRRPIRVALVRLFGTELGQVRRGNAGDRDT